MCTMMNGNLRQIIAGAALGFALCTPLASSAQDLVIEDRVGARADAQGALKLDGRFSVRDVYSFDSQTDFDTHHIFLDTDLRGKELTTIGGAKLNLEVDARWLLDLTGDDVIATSEFSEIVVKRTERRFGETQTLADINKLYVELEGMGIFDLSLGRSWVYEAGGAWVDGAHLEAHFADTWSAALFGGLQPDPYDYLPTVDRQTAGSFVQYTGERAQASLAYTMQLLEGTLDRHYAFSRGHWSVPGGDWARSLFLSYFLSLDLQNDPTPTMAFVNSSWWLNDTLNFSLHLAQYATSSIRDRRLQGAAPDENQRQLLGDKINTGAYRQVRLSATQRFGHYSLYQQLDFRDRALIDNRSAVYYRAGLRDSSVLGTNLFLHGRVTVRNNFQSDSTEFLGEAGYRFGPTFELDGALAYQLGRSLVADQTQDVILGNIRGIVNITPDFYFSTDYELTSETNIQQEEDETSGGLTVHTVFSRLTYRL